VVHTGKDVTVSRGYDEVDRAPFDRKRDEDVEVCIDDREIRVDDREIRVGGVSLLVPGVASYLDDVRPQRAVVPVLPAVLSVSADVVDLLVGDREIRGHDVDLLGDVVEERAANVSFE
jgi:hypothetical protein